VHENAEVSGKLWFVARGVQRLVEWSGERRVAWNCLECTRIGNPDRKATPHQVRCYLFAVGMREGATTAAFTVGESNGEKQVEVLGENRTIGSRDGLFSDQFGPWDAHLYRVPVEGAR